MQSMTDLFSVPWSFLSSIYPQFYFLFSISFTHFNFSLFIQNETLFWYEIFQTTPLLLCWKNKIINLFYLDYVKSSHNKSQIWSSDCFYTPTLICSGVSYKQNLGRVFWLNFKFFLSLCLLWSY